MPAPPYKLIILDFDGTLADSLGWLATNFNTVAKRYRFRTVSDSEADALRSADTLEIIRYLGVPAWKIPFIARHMRRLAAKDVAGISLFPGIADALARMSVGSTLAIVSSNSAANVKAILGPDLSRRIGEFACGASMFGKAAKFRRVLKRTGASAADAIAVGDEIRDIQAARDAGIAAAAVAWGYAKSDMLRARSPDHFFETVGAMTATLAP